MPVIDLFKTKQDKFNWNEFDWNEGNRDKNLLKHKVTSNEAEGIFFNKPLIIVPDIKHSQIEKRFIACGRTNNDRKLTIIFTLRNKKIRIISARSQNRKERRQYEKTSQANTKI